MIMEITNRVKFSLGQPKKYMNIQEEISYIYDIRKKNMISIYLPHDLGNNYTNLKLKFEKQLDYYVNRKVILKGIEKI